MKRKVVSLMLVSAMVAGMLAGCGSDSGSSKGGSSTETGSAAEASSSGETADDADDKSPITFEYFNADGKNGNWDNPVAKAITEATGVTLDVSYPVASQGDAKEDVALMIANDEYPDMIYAKGAATDLYQAGALIDMTDLIEKYGPNIKKMYGAELEKLKWSQDDPGIYQLSYSGVNQKTLTTGGSCQIQWAALKENDYKYPKTLDEYEKMIKSYLAAHPKTEDGLDMIGITMSASDWHWMITLGNPAGLIADASPDNGQWIIDDEYNVHYKHVTDEEKEYFKWLCRMYNEGILDPNFATQTDDDYIAKVASGRVVAITDAEWHYSQCEATLVADGKVDQTYVGLPVTLREDQVEKALLYQGTTVGWGMAITKSCEDPVRAIKFLDYLCSDEGQILYHWGIEGENYTMGDDGLPVAVTDYSGDCTQGFNNSKDYWCVTTEARTAGTIEDVIKAAAPAGYPQDFTQDIIDNYYKQVEVADKGWPVSDCNFAVVLDSVGEYQASLLELYTEYRDQLTMCSPDEFDTLYDELAQKYADAGYQAIVDERKEAYEAGQSTKLPQ